MVFRLSSYAADLPTLEESVMAAMYKRQA